MKIGFSRNNIRELGTRLHQHHHNRAEYMIVLKGKNSFAGCNYNDIKLKL